MSMSPPVRKIALTAHLVSSVGWIGAALAYVGLGIAAVGSRDVATVRAAWTAMELTGWFVIVPSALAALATGLVMSLGTGWGLFRHYWVLLSFVLTLFAASVTVVHMPAVSALAALAREAEGAELAQLGGDLFHPTVGVLVLLVITVLNVFKPRGVTRFGRRKGRVGRPEVSAP